MSIKRYPCGGLAVGYIGKNRWIFAEAWKSFPITNHADLGVTYPTKVNYVIPYIPVTSDLTFRGLRHPTTGLHMQSETR